MQNYRPLSDAAAAAVALLALWAAFRLRERPSRAVLFLLLAGAAIGLAMALDGFLHPWDERFHALVARRLVDSGDPLRPALLVDPLAPWTPPPDAASPRHLDWLHAHAWLHKPPLATWLMAAGLALFGRCELALRLPSLALLLVAAFALYRLGALLFDARVGLFAAGLCASSGMLLALATGRTQTDHPDSVLASLSALALLAAAHQQLSQISARRAGLALLFGALCGLCALSKSAPGLLPLGAWALTLSWRRFPARSAAEALLAAAGCAALAAPWALWTAHAFPEVARLEALYSLLHWREALEGHTGGVFFHLVQLPSIFGAAAPLALIWFASVPTAIEGRPGARLVVAWAALPYAVFSLAATKMPGYPLGAAPALFLMIAAAAGHLAERIERHSHRRLSAALLALLLGLPLVGTLRRWRPMSRPDPLRELAVETKAAALKLGPDRSALFGYPRYLELMFYSDHLADDRPLDEATRQRCVAAGIRAISK